MRPERLARRIRDLRQERTGTRSSSQQDESKPVDTERLQRLEERIGHLEASMEALEDSAFRVARRLDEEIAGLRSELEPRRLAKTLSEDARRRGL